VPDEVADLIDRAVAAFAEAEAALAAGDLGTYQEKVEEAEGLLRQVQELLGTEPSDAVES
jgi:hypothetical protein